MKFLLSKDGLSLVRGKAACLVKMGFGVGFRAW